MSVSKTNFSEPNALGSVNSFSDIRLPKAPMLEDKKSIFKPPSKEDIDAIVCSQNPVDEHRQASQRTSGVTIPSISILKPSMVPGIPATHSQSQPVDLGQGSFSKEIPFPLANGITPLAHYYPSSYPVLKSYPMTLMQQQYSAAITSQGDSRALPILPNKSSSFTAACYGSLVMTHPPFHSPVDFKQSVTSHQTLQRQNEIDHERPTKRRRINEETDPVTTNSSGRPTCLPTDQESAPDNDSNHIPYMEFLGLANNEGEEFINRILSEDSRFRVDEESIDFLKKIFTCLSTALEKRQLGTTRISDANLGKLVVSTFRLAKSISRRFNEAGNRALYTKTTELILNFVNKNHCIALHIKTAINSNYKNRYHIFGGKFKFVLMMWCIEQGISLNKQELTYLSSQPFQFGETAKGAFLLKKLRERVKDIQTNLPT
jgi:hypothetical protein